MRWRLSGFVAAAVIVGASPDVSAQNRWHAEAAVVLSRDVRHENGPSIGAFGADVRIFLPSSRAWSWGGSLGYHGYGRFDYDFSPGFHADRSAFLAGARLQRASLFASPVHGTLGLDLVLGMEDVPDTGVGRDPGIGGYLGLGVKSRSGGGGLFAELGLSAVAVTGESTDAGGVYPTLMVGLCF